MLHFCKERCASSVLRRAVQCWRAFKDAKLGCQASLTYKEETRPDVRCALCHTILFKYSIEFRLHLLKAKRGLEAAKLTRDRWLQYVAIFCNDCGVFCDVLQPYPPLLQELNALSLLSQMWRMWIFLVRRHGALAAAATTVVRQVL